MDKLKNKNTIVLIISAVLILIAIIVAVVATASADKDKKDEQAVTLMTLHAAKGLEFPVVFMAGMEDGIFPHGRSIAFGVTKTELEEERRLCYVAITRAKQSLTISHARQRMLYGRTTPGMASVAHTDFPAECQT